MPHHREIKFVESNDSIKKHLLIAVSGGVRLVNQKNLELFGPCLVKVQDGKISTIEDTAHFSQDDWIRVRSSANDFIDAKNCFLTPAFVNGHTHLPMVMFRGTAEDLSFHEWLHKVVFPLEAEFLDTDNVRVSTEFALLESFRSGVIAFNEMYYFDQTSIEAMNQAGAIGWVGRTVLDGLPRESRYSNICTDLVEAREFISHYSSQTHTRVLPTLAPHSLYTSSPKFLTQCGDLVTELQSFCHVHFAESPEERIATLANTSMEPMTALEAFKLLGPRTMLAHAVELSSDDYAKLAQWGATLSLNPVSNAKLGNQMPHWHNMNQANSSFVLGTDGAASSNHHSMLRVIQFYCLATRSGAPREQWARAEDLLVAAFGGRAERWMSAIGWNAGIQVGGYADFILWNADALSFLPGHSVVSDFVFSASDSDIHSVYSGGRCVWKQGESPTLDQERIRSEMRVIGKQLACLRAKV